METRTGGTPAERLAIAEIVLRHAERGATEAEVLVMARCRLTRFANSEIHQNVAEANVRVNLRFVRGKRVAVATTGEPTRRPPPAGGDGRADQQLVEETPDWTGLPESGPIRSVAARLPTARPRDPGAARRGVRR